MTWKNKSLGILVMMFFLVSPVAFAQYIDFFSGIRSNAPFSINTTTLSLQTLNTTQLFIDASGNIGIGNLNPNASLHVSNGSQFDGPFNVTDTSQNATFEGDVRIRGTLFGGSPLKIAGGVNITGAEAESAFIVKNSSGDVIFSIDSQGQVNASGSILAQGGSSNTSEGTGGGGTFSNNSDINVTAFVANNTFFVNGSRVGVGTSAPATDFHLSGTDPGLRIDRPGTGFTTIGVTGVGGDSQTLSFDSGQASSGFVFRPRNAGSSQLNALFIRNDRFIGLGTTAPTSELTVIGEGNFTAGLIANDTFFVNGSRIGIGIDDQTAFVDVQGATSSAASLRLRSGSEPSSPNAGDLYSSGESLFYFDGSSWVNLTESSAGGFTDDGTIVRLTTGSDILGVGTASGTEKLTVSGNTSVSGTAFVGGSLVYSGLSNGVGGTVGWSDDGGVVRLVSATDLVGIGTASPTDALTVVGTVNATNFTLTTACSDGQILEFSNGYAVCGTDDGGVSPGTALNLTELNASGEVLLATDGSNVGIGATNPGRKLTVSGLANISTGSAGGVAYDTSGDDLIVEGSGSVGITIASPDNENSYIFFASPSDEVGALMNWNHNSDLLRFGSHNAGGEVALLGGNNVEAVRIDSSGNVGIGNSSPARKLHVAASVDSDYVAVIQNTRPNDQSADVLELRGGSNSFLANTVYIALADGDGTEHAWIQGAGDSADAGIAISTTTENAYDLVIDESGFVGAKNLAGSTSNDLCYDTTTITGANTLSTCSSSERYKEGITNLTLPGLETVLALRPVEFDWKSDHTHDFGFIAEELEQLHPMLATYYQNQTEGVRYKQITALLTKAIQEQQAQIENLQAQLEELQNE